MTTAGIRAVVSTGKGKMDNVLKKSRWVWKPKGNWENVVKPLARCEWRPINVLDNVSKDSASMILKRVDLLMHMVDPRHSINIFTRLRFANLLGIKKEGFRFKYDTGCFNTANVVREMLFVLLALSDI
ncbi:hypothetical protein Tco_0013582 [Tanacetum coccineum]